jgi:ABC-type sugar transport system ATPase subunit
MTEVNEAARSASSGGDGPEPLLSLRGIDKHFGPVQALYGVNLDLFAGTVTGLCGDNGAGKSVLTRTIAGAHQPDHGEIFFEGQPVHIRSTRDASALGIETVYQDLALVDTMSAYHNVYLGREQLARPWLLRMLNLVDDGAMRKRSQEVLDALAVKIPSIKVTVKGMSGGQRQCLAIARAILWGRRIVILDEPTAALGVRESRQVLDVIKDLRNHNVSVIVVSHNMQQLMEVADRITVMRLGRTVATRVVRETTAEEIVGLITGAIGADVEEESRLVAPQTSAEGTTA